jgi:hypothetical protein
MEPLAPLSPDYEALRDFMREKFGLSNDQATSLAYWLEMEYDGATDADAALQFTYFEWLATQAGKTAPLDYTAKIKH